MAAVASSGRAERLAGLPAAEAAGRLYEAYHQRVVRYCVTCLGSREEAEDAAQSTFLHALRALERGVEPQAEAAWLFAIARNVCLARQRARGRRRELEALQDPVLLQDVSAAPERSDGLSGIEEALASLPENQRRAVLLRDWQGLSYREIADDLGLSGAAVETLIFRARRSLAKQLDAERAQEKRRVLRGFDVGSAAAALKSLLGVGAAAKLAVVAVTVAAVAGVATVVEHVGPREQPTVPPPAVRQSGPTAAVDGHVRLNRRTAAPTPRRSAPEQTAKPKRSAGQPTGQTGDPERVEVVDDAAGNLGERVGKTVPAPPETSLPDVPELPIEPPPVPDLGSPEFPLS